MSRTISGLYGAEGMGPDEVVGWMLMLSSGLHLRLMNAVISLIPTAVIDMTRSVPLRRSGA